MAKYVVAVSGGVDSVVLLDMLMRDAAIWEGWERGELVVAHFDHGIREDSAEDAAFVAGLAEKYHVAFETRREELGKNASEEMARIRRYAFLRSVAQTYGAQLVTAHHADDMVETVAINLIRGTGWRGLAVLDAPDIWRPLLDMTKQEILQYASQRGLKWREDSTNSDDRYLRNRLRYELDRTDAETKQWVRDLRERQVALKRVIDQEVARLAGVPPYSRYFFTHCGDAVALELLRHVLAKNNSSPTIVQRQRALHAIKAAKPQTAHDVSGNIKLQFSRTEFIVE